MSGRTAFIVDGFNVYHSVVEASQSLGYPNETGPKWLNLRSLCESMLPQFGQDASVVAIFYFSAYANFLQSVKPGVAARHKQYVRALKATGITVGMGEFKPKYLACKHCNKKSNHPEEKETDVAVAVKVLELFIRDEADRAVIITGDTDVAPVVRTARDLFPDREVCFAFPWNRKRDKLADLVKPNVCISISREAYVANQFPDPLVVGKRKFAKPATW